MEVLTLKLNSIQVLGLAAAGVVMGVGVKRLVPALDRLNIPASVIGGLIYATVALFLRDRYLNLDMEMVVRDVLMVAFFTTVGMSASLRLVRQGGRQLVIFLIAAVGGLLLQNGLGAAIAKSLGLDPLIGLLAGSVALTGGPATALAFGKTFEEVGVTGGTAVGLASAVFGIVASGLIGGWVGGALVKGLAKPGASEPPRFGIDAAESLAYADDPAEDGALRLEDESVAESSPLLTNVLVLAISMGLGSLVSLALERGGLILPAYIGAMICAGIVRNLDDSFHFAGISQHRMDEIGNIALDLFIVMALLTLRLWELVHLAGPVMLILASQVVLVVVLCRLLIFPLMGRNYNAAVMSSGYTGFMLGTTANAMACMNELTRKSGPAPQAFFVVSIVGAFLIDFINSLVITQTVNLLR